VVEAPLRVVVGETLPHCETLQETVQVTPLPDVSPVRVAVTEAVPVAISELELAETETVIAECTIIGELPLPPPQPGMIVTEANPRSERANHAVRFICASPSAIVATA
jgi:hypothetical protein